MSKYTKGPWTVGPGQEASGMRGYRIGTRDCVVAEIFPRPYLVAVSSDNAHLIAAAPEMYEALKSVVEYCEARGRDYPAAAWRAIVRAEGHE